MLSDTDRQNLRSSIKAAVSNRDAGSAIKHAKKLAAESGKPADVMFCASALAGIAESIKERTGVKQLKAYVVRSVTVEPIMPFLAAEAIFSNYFLELQIGGYGSYADELLNPASALAAFEPDLVLVLLDLEEMAGRLPQLCANGIGTRVEEETEACAVQIAQLLRSFRSRSAARILFQGLVAPDQSSLGDVGNANLAHSLPHAIFELNKQLARICRSISDCVFFDADHLAARSGRARWRDARMFLASRLPVAAEFFGVYARGLIRTFSVMFRAPRKVLCTDLDNTLWGGVLGEDGAEGIASGSAFPGNCYLEYQRLLKQLSSRGILLAIVSKNNEADVREAFSARAADLALSLGDFVACKVGWSEKTDAIEQLAQELSLGLDSFVFVDDNPVECAAIQLRLPDVAVVNVPIQEPWKFVEILSGEAFFDTHSVTDDDVHRLSEYKAQTQRTELASNAGSRDEFLASLEIVCTFQSALQAPLSRAVQLLAKTNQFNLTTRRRSAAEVEEFAANGQAVVVRVRDRFGDAGVVGLALARNRGDRCIIDSLLLSCRVIGRGIETAILAFVAENAIRTGANRLVGEFIATKKNAPCASFYSDHGFTGVNEDESADTDPVFYELDLTAKIPKAPQWIKMEGYETNEQSRSAAITA